MRKRVRVSIVDDNKGMRESMREVVETQHNLVCVSDYSSAEDALKRLPDDRPDVVLMDINMKRMDGIECTRRLKSRLPEVQIVMLTVFENADKIFDALAAGASGYLLKRLAVECLVDSIHEVVAGGSPMSAPIARKVVRHFQTRMSSPAAEGSVRLADREREVLDGLAEGLAYKQIADKLGLSIATIRTYIGRIYEKLHVHTRTAAVAKYIREG